MHTQQDVGVTTFSGRLVMVTDPDPSDILVKDIAQALSMQCRYNGQIREFYSVAQHSVLCSKVAEAEGLSEKVQFEALFHDAVEAYLSDIPRPIKRLLPEYIELENHLDRRIRQMYDLPPEMSKQCKTIDNRILHTEARDLGVSFSSDWGNEAEGPYPDVEVVPFGPFTSRASFIDRFIELTGLTQIDIDSERV